MGKKRGKGGVIKNIEKQIFGRKKKGK